MATPNLALVELTTNQANPENVYNDNLIILDMISQLVVEDITLTTPPGSPSNGERWIPAATATGAWAGHENEIAYYWNGWGFITPQIGWILHDLDSSERKEWSGSAWTTLASTATNGDVTTSGTVADNEVTRYNTTSGDSIQGSTLTNPVLIDDSNALYGHYAKLSSDKTANYEVVAADAGQVIVCNHSSAITITLDDGISTTGFQVVILNRGAGTVTVAKEGSDTLESKDSLTDLAQYASCTALRLTSSVWAIYGDLS